MRFYPIAIIAALLLIAGAVSMADQPKTLNDPDTVWRYTNLPPDGREALLVEESRREAEYRANLRQHFSHEELMLIISDVALRHGLEPELMCAIAWAESRYNPYIESNMGAQGLMQLMPNTAPRFGVRNPMNPVENAEGGARLFRWLLDEYDNDLMLALAAYNAGTGSVKKGGTVPPFSQTRNFVNSVLTIRDHFRNRRP